MRFGVGLEVHIVGLAVIGEQGGHGYHDDVLELLRGEGHLGGHAGLEARVGCVDHDVDGEGGRAAHTVVGHLGAVAARDGGDARHAPGHGEVGEGGAGDGRGLVDGHARDVLLLNLDGDLHLGEVGDLHERAVRPRAAQALAEIGAHLCIHGHDGARGRCLHSAQGGLCSGVVVGGLCGFNCDLGGVHRLLSAGDVSRGAGHGIGCGLGGELLCLGERLLCGRQVGAGLTQRTIGLRYGAVELGVLDGHEDVALFDRLAGNDVDALDLAAHLGCDDGGGERLQRSLGVDDGLEISLDGKIGDGLHRLLGLFTQDVDGNGPATDDDGRHADYDAAAYELLAAALGALRLEGGVCLGVGTLKRGLAVGPGVGFRVRRVALDGGDDFGNAKHLCLLRFVAERAQELVHRVVLTVGIGHGSSFRVGWT